MFKHWKQAEHLLKILVWRCLGYDEDGMDLRFTRHNTTELPGTATQGLWDFERAMANAKPSPNDPQRTQMGPRLGPLLAQHIWSRAGPRSKTKDLTVIILTDGQWGDIDTIYNRMKEWVSQVRGDFESRLSQDGRFDSRPLSIQFIRFGSDPAACELLDCLDNQLPKNENLP